MPAKKRGGKAQAFRWGKLSEKQYRVIESAMYDTNRLNFLDGAVRSGKTICSIVAWRCFLEEQAPQGYPLLITGRTERTLKRNVIDPMISMWGESYVDYRASAGELWLGGRLHYIAGASDERAENKIRGMTIGGWYGDEITLYPQSFFKMGLSRMSVTGARGFFTTNPDSPGHYLKKEFLDRETELELIRWQFRLEDNLSLPPEYVKALKKEYTGLFYKRFIEGLWCMAEGAIYDMLNPDLHYVKGYAERPMRAWVGIDYGTTNPFVAVYVVLALDPKTQLPRLYVADELRWDSKLKGSQRTDAEYSQMLKEWLDTLPVPPERIFVDPSAASFIVQAHSRDGIKGITPANNDVLYGIRQTSSLITNEKLVFVEDRVKPTIEEVSSYVWDDKAQERGEDKPVKAHDHGADALRYVITGTYNVWKNWVSSRPVVATARRRS